MSTDDETDRRAVKTYVPEYQKSEWKAHADELGMSQSEFLRTMVQAGRRGFSVENSSNPEEGSDQGDDPRGDGLETRVEDALAGGARSWDALVEDLSGNFEDRLEQALDSLQDRNRVRYRPREGGYALVDE
ncbi:DUF5805 domain-containing protein [Halorubrum gandharaense]